MANFSEQDLKQMENLGISKEEVESQIERFKTGFPYMPLVKPATIGDGIKQIPEDKQQQYINVYESLKNKESIKKFTPASGAASRMFKHLFAFMQEYDGSKEAHEKFINNPEDKTYEFFKNIEHFAFYEDLKQVFKDKGESLEESLLKQEYVKVLRYLLTEEGLNYGNLPKGLLKFHQYKDGSRTPAEEHMVEGAQYARQHDDKVRLHFTVSPEHQELFEKLAKEKQGAYEKEFEVKYEIDYSRQKLSTNTIAVDLNNEPFREDDGSLLFRPAGHGALLENLNIMDADIIFIKNIDNVVPDRIKDDTIIHKKILASVLEEYRNKVFGYLEALETPDQLKEGSMEEIRAFVEEDLCNIPDAMFSARTDLDKVAYLIEKLNRPIRVCGMVKAEGSTGGGPFWARNPDGSTSLQIVEDAQINMDDPDQKAIVDQSTHFNPVDIACCIKDYQGEIFDLKKFIDHDTGFISKKSKDGRDLKALELPGLWNGAMSEWTTIFVEVPAITFNPVKTINDLLKDNHQNK